MVNTFLLWHQPYNGKHLQSFGTYRLPGNSVTSYKVTELRSYRVTKLQTPHKHLGVTNKANVCHRHVRHVTILTPWEGHFKLRPFPNWKSEIAEYVNPKRICNYPKHCDVCSSLFAIDVVYPNGTNLRFHALLYMRIDLSRIRMTDHKTRLGWIGWIKYSEYIDSSTLASTWMYCHVLWSVMRIRERSIAFPFCI